MCDKSNEDLNLDNNENENEINENEEFSQSNFMESNSNQNLELMSGSHHTAEKKHPTFVQPQNDSDHHGPISIQRKSDFKGTITTAGFGNKMKKSMKND